MSARASSRRTEATTRGPVSTYDDDGVLLVTTSHGVVPSQWIRRLPWPLRAFIIFVYCELLRPDDDFRQQLRKIVFVMGPLCTGVSATERPPSSSSHSPQRPANRVCPWRGARAGARPERQRIRRVHRAAFLGDFSALPGRRATGVRIGMGLEIRVARARAPWRHLGVALFGRWP